MLKSTQTNQFKEFVTVGEAAKLLGVSIDTVRRWDKSGVLTSQRLDGKNRYFDIDDIEELLSRKSLSTSEVAKRLGVSVSTVRRLENNGQLVPRRDEKGRRAYSQKDVDLFLNPSLDIESGLGSENILTASPKAKTKEGLPVPRQSVPPKTYTLEIALPQVSSLKYLFSARQKGAARLGVFVSLTSAALIVGLFFIFPFIKTSVNRQASIQETSKPESSLQAVAISGEQIKLGSISSDRLAEGSIKINHLSSEVIALLNTDRNTAPIATQGAPGPQGSPGQSGADGSDGSDGADGAVGPQGAIGPQGASGIQGPQGLQGPPGSGSTIVVEENDGTATAASIIDFLGSDFNITESPAGEINVSIDYANAFITRGNASENIVGSWTFNDSSFVLRDAADNTKTVLFELAGVSSGATRTLIAPNVNGTLITTGNLSDINNVGTISSGNWQGSIITAQYGGTGLNGSLAANGQLLIGNGSGYTLATLAAGGGVTITNGSGSITIASSLGNSISGSEIEFDAVSLGGQTTGNYVANIGSTTGISISGNTGEGSMPTLAVLYGSSANTAVQGNTAITCASGTGNLSGGGNSITLGNGGSCGSLSISDSPTFATSVTAPTLTSVGNLTLAASGNLILSGFDCTTYLNGGVLTVSSSGVLSCDNDDGGAGGSISGGGTSSRIPLYTGTTTLGSSWLSQNGSTIEIDNTRGLSLLGGNLSVDGQATISGNINSTTGVLQTGSTTRISNVGALQNVTATSADGVSFNANTINSGTLSDLRLSSNVTTQGNTFNGTSQLVQTTNLGYLPSLNGSLLTSVDAVTLAGQAGSYYLNLANSTGALNDARLSNNVTLAGNTFNGNSQLIQTTTGGLLPGLNGSLLTNINAATLNGQAGSYYANANNLTGTLNDARLSSNVTLAGNTFNGTSQLVQTTNLGYLPALNGSLLTNVDASNLAGQAASYYLDAGNLNGSLSDARLSINVTTQGNTFNGVSQLVKTTNLGYLPSLNGSLITDVDALTLAGQAAGYYLDAGNLTGALNDLRLSSNVTLAGNAFNGNSQLIQTTASGLIPALDGSLITNVSAATLGGQAGSYYLDAGNLTGNLDDARLSSNITAQGNTFNGINQLVKLDSGGLLPTLDGSALTNLNSSTLNGQTGSYYLDLTNATGTLNNIRLSSSVTLAGNTFNGNSQLVQTTAAGLLPVLNGSLVTNVNAATLNGQAGSYYLNASNLTGTLDDARLSSNVTTQGNTFNGVSQLVKTTNLGYLPSLNGSLITDVDALTLAGQAAGYYLDAGNLTGTVNDARLSGNVTLVGNTFNGNSQLVQTTAAGLLPALNGSLITNVDATTLNGQAGSYYLNAGNLAGTLDDARLSSNVTTQGNTFNGTSQLVQTTNLGYLPNLNGSLITDVDALTLAGQAGSYYLDANNLTGTLNNARLSSNVTLAGNTFNGNSQLVQTTASGYLPALDGSLITNVDATTLNGQAGSYYLDLGNATGTLNDTRLSANVTLQGNTFNGSNQLVKLDSGGLLPTLDGSALTNVNAVTLGGQAGSYYLNLANSTGALNDARLSGNVTLAGNTFNGNSQLVQTTSGGKLPALDGSLVTSVNAATLNGQAGSYYLDLGNATGTLTDANVSDNLTSSLFVGSGSATSAVDLATGEVAGNLKASNLQSVAADLGAANINVNLSNSNGSFVTNLTLDGTITASSFSGALVGNASTASALAANPTDCSANQFATAIAANGNLTCAALTDGDIPNSITIDLAATATTLAANPTDCSANQFANAIAANGNLTCAALTDADVSNTLTASLFVGSGSTTNAIDLATAEVAGNLRANNLQNAAADLGAANVTIDLSNNNGSFNTSLIVDGTITAATFSGSLTGNASTATALAANPTDCGANQFATTIAASGNLTCATPTLGTDTAGDYVANLTAGNGIGVTGTPGEAWSPSLAVLYGSSANTAVQGNVSLSCASVSGTNLTGGGGSITLGAGGSCSSLGFSGTPNFTSVTATGTVQAATLNATGTIQLNGASINTAGTLSNVAYLDQANTLTAAGTALIVSNNAAINGQLSVGSLRIGASATAGYVLTADASGNATWAPQEVQQVWNGTTLTNGGNKIWTGSASTTSGTATIFLTDNGLTGGNAIFGTIYSVQVTQFGGTSATTSYVGTVRSYTAGTKALVIALSTTGTTTANPTTAPNGSVAYVTVIGN